MGRRAHHLPCWVPSRRLKTSFTTMGLSLMSFGRAWITSFYKGKAWEAGQTHPPTPSKQASPLLTLGRWGASSGLTKPLQCFPPLTSSGPSRLSFPNSLGLTQPQPHQPHLSPLGQLSDSSCKWRRWRLTQGPTACYKTEHGQRMHILKGRCLLR